MTVTQAEIDAAVAKVTVEKDAEISRLKAEAAEAQTGSKHAEALAAKDAEIVALQAKVDAADVAKAAAEKAAADAEAARVKAETDAAEEKAAAGRLESRKAEVATLGLNLTKAQIDEKAPRWAALSDEAWAGQLADWKEIAAAAGGGVARTVSGAREMAALAVGAGAGDGGGSATAAVEALRVLQAGGIDPRNHF